MLINGSLMQSTHRAELNLNPLLTPTASISHIFSHIHSGSLISIGQVFNYCCATTFTATHLTLVNNDITLLEVHRSGTSGILKVNLTRIPCHQPSSTIPSLLNGLKSSKKPELSKWYHATLFIPVRQTLIQAIKKG